MTFFQKNPQVYRQAAYPRRGGGYTAPQITLHTYEAPHTRSLLAAATWLIQRTDPGGYHALAGAASERDVLPLAPWSYETWHCVPSNNWSIGISAVAYAHQWATIPATARRNLVRSMAYAAANAADWLETVHGRIVQPRLLTRAQAMRKESGFVYHATMDPGRRTDPGAGFPWTEFIAHFNALRQGAITPPQSEEDIMATAEELRAIVREEVERSWSQTFNASTDPIRPLVVSRQAALAGSAELHHVRMDPPHGTEVIRGDDAIAEILGIVRGLQSGGADPDAITAAIEGVLGGYTLTLTKES